MHGPLRCGHALVNRQIPPMGYPVKLVLLPNSLGRWGLSTGEGSPSRSSSILKPPMSGGDILSEPTRGWCPNRNTWFPLELRWRPSRAAIPTKPCSYKEQVIGSASSHLRWNAGSILGLASSWAREAGFGLCGKSCKPVSKTKKIKKTKTNIRVDTGIWEL